MSQHVVPRGGRWAVRRGGSKRATKIVDDRVVAIVHALRLAERQRTHLYVHGSDGRVQGRLDCTDGRRPVVKRRRVHKARHKL